MTANTNITKSVIIKPGESFTLPPNSSLTFVNGTLSSTGCPIPASENYQCFGAMFNIADGGQPSEPLGGIDIKGFRISGQDYLFSTPLQLNAGDTIFSDGLATKINNNDSLKTLLTSICGARYVSSNSRNGARFIISFKSLPSIMVSAFLITRITGETLSGGGLMDAYLPIKTRSQLTTEGVDPTTCVCTS